MSGRRVPVPGDLVRRVDRGGGDVGEAEDPHLTAQPFGVSETVSWYENPGAEWTPDPARRSCSSRHSLESHTSRVDSSQHYMESPVQHTGFQPSQSQSQSSVNNSAVGTGQFAEGTVQKADSAGKSVGQERPVSMVGPTRAVGLVGLVTPPCTPRVSGTPNPPTAALIAGVESRSRTLPRSWISSNYILVQKESLKDEDLVWL